MALALGVVACGPGYLDKAEKIPATEENKAVFAVLQKYHKAMEDQDSAGLKELISARYHENGGTTHTDEDDYGIDKLHAAVLGKLRDNVKRLQFRIRLVDLSIKDEKALVDYEYHGRVLLTEGGRDAFHTWNDFNRMVLIREDGGWKISSGL
jgi:hypothetical protein